MAGQVPFGMEKTILLSQNVHSIAFSVGNETFKQEQTIADVLQRERGT